MNWYLQSGKDSDVVISSKIKFYRNLSGFNFNLKSKKEVETLKNTVKENLYKVGYDLNFLELIDMDEITRKSLIEKNIVNKEFVSKNSEDGAILINSDENICALLNDEDNLKLQVFSAGFELTNTLNYAIEIDEKFQETFGYQTNKKYGYLTADLRNCGTGLRASAILHLPGLVKTGNIEKINSTLRSLSIAIKNEGMDMYEISNMQTLGLTEHTIIRNLNVVIQKIIEQEREARKFLAKDKNDIEDVIYRSLGILENCRKIDLKESNSLISNIKLGTDLGIIKKLSDYKIMKLILYSKPANMQKMLGEQYDKLEQDIKRAEVIQNIIREE